MFKKNKKSAVSQGSQGNNQEKSRDGLVEIIIPTAKNIGDSVVYLGKRYVIVKKLEEVHVNGLLSYALGEEAGDY